MLLWKPKLVVLLTLLILVALWASAFLTFLPDSFRWD